MSDKEDLRIIKTKKNIKDAFLNLLQKHSLDEISVKQICEEANCSRNTFYYHFEYKENLYKTVLYELIENIYRPDAKIVDEAEKIDEDVLNDYCVNIINYFSPKRDLIRILARSGAADDLEKWIADRIYNSIIRDAEHHFRRERDVNYELMIHYVAAGLSSFLYNWLIMTEIDDQQAQEVLSMIHQPAIRATSAYLQQLKKIHRS